MSREISFAQALNEGTRQAMEVDPKVICFGLGVDDPKGIFGTTTGLQEQFGKERVFDIPCSENAMTGVAIGASLRGFRPIMTHQRLDFALLSLDQIVNTAAKWCYMYNGQTSVPITIRMIIGRGWGQGPTHSQSLHSWFAHIPGLKVVMPTTPYDAKGLLLESVFDDNPVIFLEHRWLHNAMGEVPEESYRVPIGDVRFVEEGSDLTLVSLSYMTVEAGRALNELRTQGISCDHINLRTISPIHWEPILKSVKKTGRLLVADSAVETASLAGEIVSRCFMELGSELKAAKRVTLPDFPTPSSYGLTRSFYKRAEHIVEAIGELLSIDTQKNQKNLIDTSPKHHDVPGEWFKGPF